MRDYYKSILKRMPDLIGVDPYKSMGETKEEIKASVSSLLDALEKVSKLYSYIPESAQKEIIERQLLVDKDWLKLNARLISKWLEQNGKHYFKEEAHQPVEGNARPLEGAEREKWIDTYLKAIASVTTNFTEGLEQKGGSGTRLRENIERSTGNQKFVFDGFEIWAKTEEEARNIYETQVGKR